MDIETIKSYQNTGLKGNELKNIIQPDAINTWLRGGGKGIIKAFTGFGKGTLARLAISRYISKFPENYILVVVPSQNLQVSWTNWLNDLNVKNFSVKVINSFALILEDSEKDCNLFIVDEVHHCLGTNALFFNKVIQDTKFDYFLGLTATLTEEHEKYLNELGLKVLFDIDIRTGACLKLLPSFIIYNLGITLDKESQISYVKASSMYEEAYLPFRIVGQEKAFELAMCCAITDEKFVKAPKDLSDNMDEIKQSKKYRLKLNGIDILCSRDEAIAKVIIATGLDRKEIIAQAFIWLKSMKIKSSILSNSVNKLKVIHKYLDTSSYKTILFTGGIKVSEMLQKGHTANTVVYNSKLSKAHKLKVLTAFERNIIQNLITVRALDEGYDVKNIDTALNVDYTGNEGTFIQRLGRTLRNDETNANKVAKMINFYHKPFSIELEGFIYKVIPHDLKKLKSIQKNAINIQLINSIEEFYDNSI